MIQLARRRFSRWAPGHRYPWLAPLDQQRSAGSCHAFSEKHVDKLYRAQVDGIMTQEDVERFAAGIELKDFTSQPAQLTILSTDEAKQTSLVDITIREGKFHQVKRMVQACGKTVTDLQRLTMGPLRLDPKLALGEYRRLTAAELKQLEVFGVEL